MERMSPGIQPCVDVLAILKHHISERGQIANEGSGRVVILKDRGIQHVVPLLKERPVPLKDSEVIECSGHPIRTRTCRNQHCGRALNIKCKSEAVVPWI